jgi:hypothetical protein
MLPRPAGSAGDDLALSADGQHLKFELALKLIRRVTLF